MKNIAILSGAKLREQPWKLSAKVPLVAILEASSIDFRKAELEEMKTKVTAFSLLGATRVIVPAGMWVNLP